MKKNALLLPLTIFFALVFISLFSSCRGQDGAPQDLILNEELAQQSGDLMTSVDEIFLASSSSVSTLINNCSSVGFSSCVSNRRTKNFNGCTLRFLGSLDGLVNLDFTPGTNCSLVGVGSQVTRTPNFNIRGRRGTSFFVTGGSQTLIRNPDSTFNFMSSNIRRRVTSGSVTRLDLTTSTTSALLIQGSSRANRQVVTGAFNILDNLTSVSCSVSIQNLGWSSNCSCPTQGLNLVTCSDGRSMSISYTNMCGRVTLTSADSSSQIDLDRCY